MKQLLSLTSLLLLTVLFATQPIAHALSADDVDSILNNTTFYDPNDALSECGTGGGGSVNLTGSDNENKAMNYLTSQGLTKAQAAGIVGNLKAESSLDPKADNNGNYKGIAQWDTNPGGRWERFVTWAEANGYDKFDFGAQIQYAYKEASDRGQVNGIKAYDDVPHTTWYWGRYFEVAIIGGSTSETPLTNVQHLDARTAFAQQIFDGYNGGDGDTAATDDSVDCNADDQSAGGEGALGIGRGGFTDSGEVAGYQTVLANSQLSEKVYGDSLEWRGACASIVSRVWHGNGTGFGYSPLYAMTLYATGGSAVHKDNKPKKGSILLYTGSTKYGHVTIYLGDNKILNDGHITDATVKADDYLAWVDPNDIGWRTNKFSGEAAIRAVLDRYLSW